MGLLDVLISVLRNKKSLEKSVLYLYPSDLFLENVSNELKLSLIVIFEFIE